MSTEPNITEKYLAVNEAKHIAKICDRLETSEQSLLTLYNTSLVSEYEVTHIRDIIISANRALDLIFWRIVKDNKITDKDLE